MFYKTESIDIYWGVHHEPVIIRKSFKYIKLYLIITMELPCEESCENDNFIYYVKSIINDKHYVSSA